MQVENLEFDHSLTRLVNSSYVVYLVGQTTLGPE